MMRAAWGIALAAVVLAAAGDGWADGKGERGYGKDREKSAFGDPWDMAEACAVEDLLDDDALDLEAAERSGDKERTEWGKKLHRECDKNGDGELSDEEREKARKMLSEKRLGYLRERCKKECDLDRDGKFTGDEEAKAHKKMEELCARMDAKRKTLAERFDDDGDGKLNGDERASLRQAWKEHRKQCENDKKAECDAKKAEYEAKKKAAEKKGGKEKGAEHKKKK